MAMRKSRRASSARSTMLPASFAMSSSNACNCAARPSSISSSTAPSNTPSASSSSSAISKKARSEEHTSELQSHSDLHSFPTRRSSDLVRVYIGVNGNEKEQAGVIRALDHAAGFVRHELVERLQLRRAPELHFVLDRSEQYTERIEQLLRDIKKSEIGRAHV